MDKGDGLRSQYTWIPSAYILQGLPFAWVTTASMVLLRQLHVNNAKIALMTSLFAIPWFLKPIFAPLMELHLSRQACIVLFPIITASFIILLVWLIGLPHFLFFCSILFFLMALSSALYDLNVDGLYIASLDRTTRIRFLSVSTISYQLGRLIGQGGLLTIVSYLTILFGVFFAWKLALILLAAFLILVSIYHFNRLPAKQEIIIAERTARPFSETYQQLVKMPHIICVLLLVFVYPFSENQLVKIVPLFFLNYFSVAKTATLIGMIGISGMITGMLCSSLILKKISLYYVMFVMAILGCLVNTSYIFLSLHYALLFLPVGIIFFLTQFIFGISNCAYMLYLLDKFGKGPYSMSLYSIGTALMGFGAIIAGVLSGYLQEWLGYTGFFSWIFFCGLAVTGYTYFFKKVLF